MSLVAPWGVKLHSLQGRSASRETKEEKIAANPNIMCGHDGPVSGDQQKMEVFAKRIREEFVMNERAPSMEEYDSFSVGDKGTWHFDEQRVVPAGDL